MSPHPVTFNRPHVSGKEFECMTEAIRRGHLSDEGPFRDLERGRRRAVNGIGRSRAMISEIPTTDIILPMTRRVFR